MNDTKYLNIIKTDNTLSDANLLKQKFKVHDPEKLPNLSSSLPLDYREAQIEYGYNVRPRSGEIKDRPYVWCAHDEQPTHWKGYVMKSPSGIRFLIGAQKCGKDIYGLDFNAIENNFKELEKRQDYIKRWQSTLAALPTAIDALNTFLKDPTLGHFSDARVKLEKQMPDLYKQLKISIMRHDSKLLIDERIRDFAAEEKRSDEYNQEDEAFNSLRKKENLTLTEFQARRKAFNKEKKNRNKQEIYKIIHREIGRLAGENFIKSRVPPKRIVSECIANLNNLYNEMKSQETEQFSNRKLYTTLDKVKKCISKIDTELKKLQSARDFFGFRNLTTIASWATKHADIYNKYKVNGHSLVQENNNRHLRISLPSNYQVPDKIQDIESLRVALSRAN